jgi:hypothetical protein
LCISRISVPDPNPDPDPPAPHIFGPPGSGSTSQRYASGSFYHQTKIVRKALIPTVLWLLLYFLSLKIDVKVPSKSKKQKNFIKIISFLLASWRSMTKILGSGSASGSAPKCHGSGALFRIHQKDSGEAFKDKHPAVPS